MRFVCRTYVNSMSDKHNKRSAAQNPIPSTKPFRTCVSLPPEVVKMAEDLEEVENRSFNNLVSTLIRRTHAERFPVAPADAPAAK